MLSRSLPRCAAVRSLHFEQAAPPAHYPQYSPQYRTLESLWDASVRKHGGLAAVGDLRRAQAARTALIAQSRAERERQARAYLAAPGVLDDATRAALGEHLDKAYVFKAIAGAYINALSLSASKAQPATLHDIAERARRYATDLASFPAALDAHMAGKPEFDGHSAASIKATVPGSFAHMSTVRNGGIAAAHRACRDRRATAPRLRRLRQKKLILAPKQPNLTLTARRNGFGTKCGTHM